MIGPTYRRAARFFFEPAPREPMAHRLPHAHREPAPEPLWRAVLVLVAGLAALWFLVNVVLVAAPQ